MIVLLFHRQRGDLDHLQIKFNHSSLILIGGIECVTIAPGIPYTCYLIKMQLYFQNDHFSIKYIL